MDKTILLSLLLLSIITLSCKGQVRQPTEPMFVANGPNFVPYVGDWQHKSRPKWITTSNYTNPFTGQSDNFVNAHAGNIIFHNGLYYWFGEFKTPGNYDNGNVHKSKVGIACYSSPNLKEWTFIRIAMPVQVGTDIASEAKIERPKVVYNQRTGKFVMWFHVAGQNFEHARCGVAISDDIAGPYLYNNNSYRPNKNRWPINVLDYHKRTDNLAAKTGYSGGDLNFEIDKASNGNIVGRDYANGQMVRDLGIFVDDDAKKTAYLIYASEENSTLHISKLTDDYTAHTGEWIRLTPGTFNEAPILFKQEGRYYIMASGCTGWMSNEGRSASATNIFGPWTNLGNPCVGFNAHKTFAGQATSAIKLNTLPAKYMILVDIWEPYVYEYANDARYAFLPVSFKENRFEVVWQEYIDVINFINITPNLK